MNDLLSELKLKKMVFSVVNFVNNVSSSAATTLVKQTNT